MIKIKVDTMRARGKHGYVRKLGKGEWIFLKEDSRSGYGSSKQELTFDITENGIYEVQDVNFCGTRLNRYYLKIEVGEIVNQTEELFDLFADRIDLPELEGTPAQIGWAYSILKKYCSSAITRGFKPNRKVLQQTSAQVIINNREKLA